MRTLKKIAFILPLAAMILASCWHEGQKDCDSFLTFTYTYNFPGADHFEQEVSSIDLLLFDGDGLYQNKLTVPAPAKAGAFPAGFTYALPRDLVNVNNIITLGGSYQNAFDLMPTSLVKGQTRLDEIQLVVKEQPTGTGSMPAVFYGGRLQDDILKPADGTPGTPVVMKYYNEVHTVELMKISKTFRILLKVTENDIPVDGSTFDFEITAPNATLGMNVEPVGNDVYPYYPYLREEVAGTNYTAAEIWTPRLMAGADNTLTITQNIFPFDMVFQEDLNDLLYALMLQAQEESVGDFQEYLDREDTYSMVIILKKTETPGGARYLSTRIEINGWLVREDIQDQ